MSHGPKKFELQLTQEQREVVQKMFGHDVAKLVASVEDFTTEHQRGETTLRVLKVDNVAAILRASGTISDVVN